MGKASKWFRGLLGFKKSDSPSPPATSTYGLKQSSKRKWSFGKSSRETNQHMYKNEVVEGRRSTGDAVVLEADGSTKHAIALAEAKAAVAEAAVATAHKAAAVVKLTSGVRSTTNAAVNVNSSGFRSRDEEWSAVKIQSHFRAYLSRRALRALKALVKLQALVRGHIVRKQDAEELRAMQAILRIQARARAKRAQIYDTPHFHNPGPSTPEKSEHAVRKGTKYEQSYMLKRNRSRSSGQIATDQERMRLNCRMDEGSSSWEQQREYFVGTILADDEKSDKILEIDTGKPHFITKRPNIFQSSLHPSVSDPNSYNFSTSKDLTINQTFPYPYSCEIHSTNPIKFTDDIEETTFCTADNSPEFYSASSKGGSSMRGPFTPSRSDGSRSCQSGYSDHPNYMAYTESSKAKVRSLSAPRQRLPLERSIATKRYSVHGGYGDVRYSNTQRFSSALHSNFTSKAYPGSGRLDRLGMPMGCDGVGFSGGLWNKY